MKDLACSTEVTTTEKMSNKRMFIKTDALADFIENSEKRRQRRIGTDGCRVWEKFLLIFPTKRSNDATVQRCRLEYARNSTTNCLKREVVVVSSRGRKICRWASSSIARAEENVADAIDPQWHDTHAPKKIRRRFINSNSTAFQRVRKYTFCRYRFNSSLEWNRSGRFGGAERNAEASRNWNRTTYVGLHSIYHE